MENDESKEPCVLHFTRVRGKGEPEFYEPNTDIRKVFPAVADIAIRYLQDVLGTDNAELLKDLDYLYRCFKIMQIRVAEDPEPLATQMDEYLNAVRKASPVAVVLWRETQFRLLASLYALFCRRDSRTDAETLHAMLETARLSLYKDQLSPETYKAMAKELLDAGTVLKDKAAVSAPGLVVCRETEQVIDSVKSVASMFLNCTGDSSWNALAEACDKQFSTSDGKLTDMEATCLALAYPSYEHNDLTVEVTKDNDK